MNENQEPGVVRADIQQLFSDRERAQARLNVRAAQMGYAKEAALWGMDNNAILLAATPHGLIGADGRIPLLNITPAGDWSTNGQNTHSSAPGWLVFRRVDINETVDGETDEANDDFPSISQDVVQYRAEFWDSGVKVTAFDWRTEFLPLELIPDLFTFRHWNSYPDTENTTLEDDSIATDGGVWIEPDVPPPLALTGYEFTQDPELIMHGFPVLLKVQAPSSNDPLLVPIWYAPTASVTPGTITASQNDYNPGVCARFLKLSTNASRNLTGLTFPYPGQVDGEAHVIVNVGNNDLVLLHNQASSDAANRFYHVGGTDITLGPDDQADIWYDATANRWRMSKRT